MFGEFFSQSSDVLPLLHQLVIELQISYEEPVTAKLVSNLTPLTTFMSQHPPEDVILSFVCRSDPRKGRERQPSPLSMSDVQMLASMKKLKALQVCTNHSGWTSDLFGSVFESNMTAGCWPSLQKLQLSGPTWSLSNITAMLRASNHLKHLTLSSYPQSRIRLLPIIARHCPLIEEIQQRVDTAGLYTVTTYTTPDSVTIQDVQAAFAACPLDNTSFQHLKVGDLQSERMTLDVMHYVFTQVSMVPRLEYAPTSHFDSLGVRLYLQSKLSVQGLWYGYVQNWPNILSDLIKEKKGNKSRLYFHPEDDSYRRFRTLSDKRPFDGRRKFFAALYDTLLKMAQKQLAQWDAGRYTTRQYRTKSP